MATPPIEPLLPQLPVLIAGGGIGGLATALALLRQGFPVVVYEQAPAFGEIGAGVQISANGARCLFALGLERALQECWSEPLGKEVRVWNSGETWKLFDLGVASRARYGAPYFMIHRGDLHRILLEAVRALAPDAVVPGAQAEGFAQDADAVTLALADGRRVMGCALIAADGVHSRIRNQLFGEQRADFIGCVAWRGLLPVAVLPERLRRAVGTNWVGPGGHVVHYLVRGGTLLNIVGLIERDDWRVESWTAQGTTEECLNDFPGWHPDIQLMFRNVATPYKWALLGRSPLARWSEGRVTLLGDAAHPTLPMMAQGANMAIEDAIVLARCFDLDRGYAAAALARYERARRERTSRIVNAANDNAKRFHNPALATSEGARRYVDSEWQEDKVKARYDWVFDYDATSVALP